ncbi:ESPR domain-containing protein [Erwinia aphidicola]|nr:ESPR domain-containing protein [Erwinia aphidicola]
MNIIYRIVWNKVSGQFVVASEFAKGKSKSSLSTHKISGAGSAARAIAGVSAILLSVSVANVAHAGLVADGVSQSYTDRDIVTSAANDYGIQGVNAGGRHRLYRWQHHHHGCRWLWCRRV